MQQSDMGVAAARKVTGTASGGKQEIRRREAGG